MEPEILRADPRYRRKVFWLLLAAMIAGALGIALLPPMIREYLQTQSCRKTAWLVIGIFASAFAVSGLFSIQMFRTALKIMAEKRFPPLGTKVVKDTPVLYDQAAVNRGKFLIFLAVFVAVLSISGMTLLLFMVYRLV